VDKQELAFYRKIADLTNEYEILLMEGREADNVYSLLKQALEEYMKFRKNIQFKNNQLSIF
jgi:hypothetical protein